MPNSTVPAMPSMTTPDGTELYYVVQGGQDRKATGNQIVSIARQLLKADTNYYVSTGGSDTTGDGTVGNPWATIQFALNWVAAHIDNGGFNVHVILAAGTAGSPAVYGGLTNVPAWVGSGNVYVETSDGAVANTKMSVATSAHLISISESTTIWFGGMWLEQAGGASGGNIIRATTNCQIFLGTPNCPNIKLGLCGDLFFQIALSDHASLTIPASTNITLSPPVTNCSGFVSTTQTSFADLDGTYTITGTPVWEFAFVSAQDMSHLDLNIAIGTNATGSSTGMSYKADGGSIIHSVGALTAIPGNGTGEAINSQIVEGPSATTTSYYGSVWSLIIDKGTVGTGTVTFNVAQAQKQKLTVSGGVTIAFTGWSNAGSYSEIEIELVNGSSNVTWPTVRWMAGDGTFSSSFSGTGVTLASSGTNWVTNWSTDGGSTIYGSAM